MEDSEYTRNLVNLITKKCGPLISYVFSEDHCIRIHNCPLFKCIRLLSKDRNLNNVTMIDSNVRNYVLSLSNGIPINPYHGDNKDNELIYLAKYLRFLVSKKDIQMQIQSDFAGYLIKEQESN